MTRSENAAASSSTEEETALVIQDSLSSERIHNAQVSNLLEVSLLVEGWTTVKGLSTPFFKAINQYVQVYDYLQMIRSGDAARVPIELAVVKAKIALCGGNLLLAALLETAAFAITEIAPFVNDPSQRYIAERKQLEEGALSKLPISQQAYFMEEGSLAEEMQAGLIGWLSLHALMHGWRYAAPLFYEYIVPDYVKSSTHDLMLRIQSLGDAAVIADHNLSAVQAMLQADDQPWWKKAVLAEAIDTEFPLRHGEARALLYVGGEPIGKWVESLPSQSAVATSSAKLIELTEPTLPLTENTEINHPQQHTQESSHETVTHPAPSILPSEPLPQSSVESLTYPDLVQQQTSVENEETDMKMPVLEFKPDEEIGLQYQAGKSRSAIPIIPFDAVEQMYQALINAASGQTSMNFLSSVHLNSNGIYYNTTLGRTDFCNFNVELSYEKIAQDFCRYLEDGFDNLIGKRIVDRTTISRPDGDYVFWIQTTGKAPLLVIGQRWSGKRIKITVQHKRTGEEQAQSITLGNSDYNSEKNRNEINKTLNGKCSILFKGIYEREKEQFLEDHAKALAENNFPFAHELRENFFGNYRGMPALVLENDKLKHSTDDYALFTLAFKTEEELRALLPQPNYAAYQTEIKNQLSYLNYQKIRSELDRFQYAYNQAISENNQSLAKKLCVDFLDKHQHVSELSDFNERIRQYINYQETKNKIVISAEEASGSLSSGENNGTHTPDIKSKPDVSVQKEMSESDSREKSLTEINLVEENNLFSEAKQAFSAVKTDQEMETVIQKLQRVLSINKIREEAIGLLVAGYFYLRKYQEAGEYVQNEILNENPSNVFGLYMKGRIQFALGDKKNGRETLEQSLMLDPKYTASRYALIDSYDEEWGVIQGIYKKLEGSNKDEISYAVSIYAKHADTLLKNEIDMLGVFIDSLKNLLEKRNEQQTQLDLLTSAENEADTEEVTQVSAQMLVRLKKGEALLEDHRALLEKRKNYQIDLKKAEIGRNQFYIQTTQIVVDGIFFVIRKIEKNFAPSFSHPPYPASPCAQHIATAETLVSGALQLAGHYYSRELEIITRMNGDETLLNCGLGYARYTLISLQMISSLAKYFPGASNQKNPLAKTLYVTDGYVMPCAQMLSSILAIVNKPDQLLAGICSLSFSLETVLVVPVVRDALLTPDPRGTLPFPRYVLGRVLTHLRDNNILNVITRGVNYVSNYSDSLCAWLSWIANMAMPKKVMQWIMNTWSKIKIPKSLAPITDIATKITSYLYVLRVVQFVYAGCKAIINVGNEWNQYALLQFLENETSAFKPEVKRLSREVRTYYDKKTKLTLNEKSLYLTIFMNRKNRFIYKSTPSMSFFAAIAYTAGTHLDAEQLYQKTVDYIVLHKNGLSAFISSNPDDYVLQLQKQNGTSLFQIDPVLLCSIEQVLNRSIVVMDSAIQSRLPFPGRPIFIREKSCGYEAVILLGEGMISEQKELKYQGTRKLRAGRYVAAIGFFNRAINLKNDDATSIARRGEAYRCLGKPIEASDDFQHALAINPNKFYALDGRQLLQLRAQDAASTSQPLPVKEEDTTMQTFIERATQDVSEYRKRLSTTRMSTAVRKNREELLQKIETAIQQATIDSCDNVLRETYDTCYRSIQNNNVWDKVPFFKNNSTLAQMLRETLCLIGAGRLQTNFSEQTASPAEIQFLRASNAKLSRMMQS
ncbi:MAG: hypothetical protein HY939_03970 [Gammaproteobacteria bacterium]|nr:hypothetical protein [Gammaproteobacteria bacterium]